MYNNQKIAKLGNFPLHDGHSSHFTVLAFNLVTGNTNGNSHVLEVLLGDAEPGGLVVPPLVVVVHGGQA